MAFSLLRVPDHVFPKKAAEKKISAAFLFLFCPFEEVINRLEERFCCDGGSSLIFFNRRRVFKLGLLLLAGFPFRPRSSSAVTPKAFAIVILRCKIWMDCVDGKKQRGEIVSIVGDATTGLPVSLTYVNINLEDGTPLRDSIYLDGEPIAVNVHQGNAGPYYYINDHPGAPPQQLIDSAGAVVWQAIYLPFGQPQLRVDTVTNNLRLPGQYFNEETGLRYNWHSYYDPETGRYISADPIGLAGGMNLYVYVENDPVNAVDPEGLHKKDKTYGLPKKFWNWYHKKRKKDGDPDLSRDEADDFLDEWKNLGEPGPDRKMRRGPKGGGRGFRGFSPLPCYTTADCFCLQHPAECCALFPEKCDECKE